MKWRVRARRKLATTALGIGRFLLWQLTRTAIGFAFFWIGFAEVAIPETRKTLRTYR
jgi:hypothetical protein